MVTYDSVAARALLDRLARLERTSPSRDPILIAEELNRRGGERVTGRRYEEAAALFRASLDVLLRHVPPEHEDARTVQRNLAAAFYMGNKLPEAESMQRAAVALEERLRGSALTRGLAHEALALTMVAEGRADSADVHEREALRLFRLGAAPEHWRIWSAQRNLAFISAGRGRVEDGLVLLDSAIATASAGHDAAERSAYLVAQRIPFLLRLKRLPEASRAVALAEQRLGTSTAVTPAHRADVDRYAGMLDLALGNTARAVDRFRIAVSLAEPVGDPATKPGISSCLLGVALARTGRMAEGRPLIDGACEAYTSRGLPDPLIVEWISAVR
jgi:tetratricopeptide (TPR) repeat protein